MKAAQAVKRKAKQRPAETSSGVAAALIVVVLSVFGLEPSAQVVAALVAIVGAVPALVSWFVDRARRP